MRKLFVIALVLLSAGTAFSQTSPKKEKKKFNIANRAGDHLMFQLSSDHWLGAADSVSSHIKGLSRGANIYIMMNKPFKSDPRLSAAFGLGVSTSHIFFKRMVADIASRTPTLPFNQLDTLSYFKKFKVSTAYLELPVELRFTSRPNDPNKSFKFAVGLKIGTLLSASTKGKNFRDNSGNVLNSSVIKTKNKSYFNTTRLAATARIGMGNFSLFGAYNITTMFKDEVAPDTKLLQVGLTFSGL